MKIKPLFLFALTFGLLTTVQAQTGTPFITPRWTFFNQSGTPLAGGLLYSYTAGTSTLAATYTDSTLSVPNPNPVVLDASGAAAIWLGQHAYKFILTDSSGVTQWSADNVSGAPTWLSSGVTVDGTDGFISSSTNAATTGFLRLAFADGGICWGGNGNGANYGCIGMGSLGVLEISGVGGGLVIDKNLTVTTGINTQAAGFLAGIYKDGSGLKHIRVAGCATAASAGAVCSTTITWTSAFADANYSAVCSGDLITSGVPTIGGVTAKSATAITVQTVAVTAAAAQFTNVDCVAIHD